MENRVAIMGSIGGAALDAVAVLTGSGQESTDPTLPAAKSGTLSTRGGNDTGTLTLATGHGILTGDRIDVYWEGGLQRGVTVGTVAGNAVPFSGGSGDNLPAQDTPILAGIRVMRSVSFNGAYCAAFGITATGRANVELIDADDVIIQAKEIGPSAPYLWWVALGVNPIASGIIKELHASTGELTDKQLRAGFLFTTS